MDEIRKINVKGTEYGLHDSGTDSYAKKLWSGSVSGSGEIEVPGIEDYRIIGVKVNRCDQIMLMSTDFSGQIATATRGRTGISTFQIVLAFIESAKVDGGKFIFSSSTYSTFSCNGIGQAMTLIAGDRNEVKEIWGIL